MNELNLYYNIMELYSDHHPNKSLKGTGFSDDKKAKKTIDLIKYRSPKYQYDVINTMYNRAKYHPHQTSEMRSAMKIFASWLKKYKESEHKPKYPYFPLEKMHQYDLQKEDQIFIRALEKVNGKYYKLQYVPIQNGKYDLLSYRNIIITNLLSKKPTEKNFRKLIAFGYKPPSNSQ